MLQVALRILKCGHFGRISMLHEMIVKHLPTWPDHLMRTPNIVAMTRFRRQNLANQPSFIPIVAIRVAVVFRYLLEGRFTQFGHCRTCGWRGFTAGVARSTDLQGKWRQRSAFLADELTLPTDKRRSGFFSQRQQCGESGRRRFRNRRLLVGQSGN